MNKHWPGDEGLVLELVADRLEHGLKEYGALDANDTRDKVQEALEEALDMSVYLATKLLTLKQEAADMVDVVSEKALRESVKTRDEALRVRDEALANREDVIEILNQELAIITAFYDEAIKRSEAAGE